MRIVGAEGVLSSWVSPTSTWLRSVEMVNVDDGWAVGAHGTIIRWTGIEWIPEFPVAILASLLISVTLIAVILVKRSSKKLGKS